MAEQEKVYVSLDVNGFAASAGYFRVYNCDPVSGEYIGANEEYLSPGVGIPAHSRPDSPPSAEKGYVAVAKSDGWHVVPDYRGATAYKKDGSGSIDIIAPGELEEGLTLDVPATPYDSWTDGMWVTDTVKQRAAQVDEAEAKKLQLIDQANAYINGKQWPSKLALARLSDAEKVMFNSWLDYIDALTVLDVSMAPYESWPAEPAR